MSKANVAVEIFNSGFNCSQAVFAAYCEQLGIDKEAGLKLACPFGSGISYTNATCGAVTGAYMLIGLKYGKYLANDNEAKEKTFNLVQKFTEKFKEIYGSVQCTDLLSSDLSTEQGYSFAKDHGLFKTLCPCYVEDAVKILEDIMKLE